MATATTEYCNICDHDNESKLAATWCPECEDLLCNDCNRHHSRSSATKQHIVISMEITRNYPVPFYLLRTDAPNMAISTNSTARFIATLAALCAQEMIIAIAKNYVPLLR